MKVVDIDKKPQNERIFFGDFGHYIRVDSVSHEIAKKLKEASEGNTWFSKEVDYKSDKTKFSSLPENAQRAFKLNIAYQTLMDSGVTSGFSSVLNRIVTSSIWSILYARIAIEENIHAESYSYGLSEVFGHEATETLDLVYNDEFVKHRMEKEVELFGNVNELCNLENSNASLDEKKQAVLQLLTGIYLLESIKFPFSFLVTFTINNSYDNAIAGFTKTIKLIAHDELNVHVPTGKNLISILRKDSNQGFTHLFNNGWYNKIAAEMTDYTVKEEIKWAKYLFDGKEVSGINSSISENFIKYWAGVRLKDLGVETEYLSEKKSDIIDWFNSYRDINKQNAALQETTNTSYQKGALKNDL
ncbi:ribonucleotide-diphosphate reductase subunit beta [uncultured Brachyspira sp.]|uniref:ribonucleotide-diphosphate reductase subunit beta n=1 Tax=uncultured Brachyspira sp. TaxID=221953 RepID=UPI0025E40C36|nr:ribonucleotide-diphosphate reductase subunit beta [uncultured Brachyspira sp.]